MTLKRGVNLFALIAFVLMAFGLGFAIAHAQDAQQALPIVTFTAEREVRVHADRSQDSTMLYRLGIGESVPIELNYVYNDELVWARLAGREAYVAVARYGVCEIRSFGSYTPSSAEPVSVGQ